MSIPTSIFAQYDFQNPSSYSGSGNTVYDLQGSTNLDVGNGNWVSGAINYWDLQGNTNLQNIAPSSTFNSNVFTINVWWYAGFTNPGFFASVWGLGINGPGTMPILSTQQTGGINIQWSFGVNAVSYTPTVDWHMYTFVSTGSATILYVDGAYVGQVNAVGSIGLISGVTRLRLGCSSDGSGNPGENAYGRIGYWDYYTAGLNAGEVLDVYNATNAPYAPPPPPAPGGIVGGTMFAQGFNG
jgi:hypothetical protein